MKKRFALRSVIRQFAEKFATILLGLICLILIIYYWPIDDASQAGRSRGVVLHKVVLVLNAEKARDLPTKSLVGITRLVRQVVQQAECG